MSSQPMNLAISASTGGCGIISSNDQRPSFSEYEDIIWTTTNRINDTHSIGGYRSQLKRGYWNYELSKRGQFRAKAVSTRWHLQWIPDSR